MFSIDHPSILPHLRLLPSGFQPVRMRDGSLCLLLKAGKETILTARINNGFKIYLVPDATTSGRALGFISAFFDDHDEPLVLFTPLYAGDEMLTDLAAALSQDAFELFFFDEHDREMLGASSRVVEADRFRQALANTDFPTLELDDLAATYEAMQGWFGLRDADDDARAFTVELGERLYPDDFVLIDARDEANDFRRSAGTVATTSLKRDEPGDLQEWDIAALLRRVFPGNTIFLNPVREDTGKEFVDVLVATDEMVLLVQAKDSPNTEAALRRSIDRKRSIIRNHIEKGAKQLGGALRYLRDRNQILLQTSSGPYAVDVSGRAICGLLVVRELFDDDYKRCSEPLLKVVNACSQPCVLLDYLSLHMMTLHLPTPAELMNGFHRTFDIATQHGEYPKHRFLRPPPGVEDPADGSAG